ncbi:MAG: M48 family metalloprotease [Bacteroidota bacterium]|nr:M48 family metalloprotease [Bacteroidota bacterium]
MTIFKSTRYIYLIIFSCSLLLSCDKTGEPFSTIEEDKKIGLQVADEIEANPDDYPLLDEAAHPFAYTYLRNMAKEVLNSGHVKYKDEFVWQIKIIHDDSVLNAFAAPGGYLYFYTGLIKYLDKADDLAGVMGHEIAHADKRHSLKQIERQMGLNALISLALGNDPGQIQEIAASLAGNLTLLQFSRDAETEADMASVEYLAETPYQCNGAFSFFQKLIDGKQAGSTPTFLSTHPNPENRIQEINNKAQEMGCSIVPLNPPSYQDFKNSLPK